MKRSNGSQPPARCSDGIDNPGQRRWRVRRPGSRFMQRRIYQAWLNRPHAAVRARDRRGQRLGRAIALGLARARLATCGATTAARATQAAGTVRRPARRRATARRRSRPTSADEAACARAGRRRSSAHCGRSTAVVNNASPFEHDDRARLRARRDGRHWRANLIAPLVLSRALLAHARQRRATASTGCVVNLLDQKLWNPNPDYFSYTCRRPRWSAPSRCWRRRWRRACACAAWRRASRCRRADERGRVRARARANAAARSSTRPTSRAPCASWSNARRSPAPPCCVDGGQHLVPQPRDVMFVVDDLLKALTHDTRLPRPPCLLDCRRLFLRDYEVWINIGVHEFEKRAEQRVLINVDLYVPLARLDAEGRRTRRGGRLRLHPPHHRHAPEQGPHPPAGNAVRRHARADAGAPEGAAPRACRPRSPTCTPTATRSASKCSRSK